MRKTLYTFVILFLIARVAIAQDDLSAIVNENTEVPKKEFVTATFKGLRIINAQTIETAKKHNLQFNVQHRFGDIGGRAGGVHTFFGLDQAKDIRISFDYGITDRLQLGVGHSRGQEPYTELYDGSAKFKLLRQTTDSKMPLSITLFGVGAVTGRVSKTDSSDADFHDSFSHRFSYVTQMVLARKFSPRFSFELIPSWVHRNYVPFDQKNDMFFLGAGMRLKFTKRFAFIIDYFHDFRDPKDSTGHTILYDPLSVGVEIETGGHVFQLTFTNSTGILENTFLPFTRSNWLNGQFRWGFNLTRNFVIGGKNY
ncbi:MAG TPA: DUF5777 family beta-barrel protein [Chitinophagales bacterium]|nr:DUF5777 family beta-barrel protein [Chitinophagales bacterium]